MLEFLVCAHSSLQGVAVLPAGVDRRAWRPGAPGSGRGKTGHGGLGVRAQHRGTAARAVFSVVMVISPLAALGERLTPWAVVAVFRFKQFPAFHMLKFTWEPAQLPSGQWPGGP